MSEQDRSSYVFDEQAFFVKVVRACAPFLLEEPIASDEEALAIWNGLDLNERQMLLDAYSRMDTGS